ncbi:MAG: amidohydrolase family protein [Candidatus Binatia bacterium]|nr:amidohydrolase family protein [Candidatus Binatia bacterium]
MATDEELISADDHVNPPATMYAERLPARFRDRAPRVESRGDKEILVFEDTERPFGALESAAGVDSKNVRLLAKTKEQGRKGGWDPDARIEDMDFDGVRAQVLFGSGSGGGVAIQCADRELRKAMMRAYNDWISEFCKPYSDRLIGIAELPIYDMDFALEEAERCAKLGLRGVLLPAVPAYEESPASDKPYTDPSYERLWATLANMNLPVHFHLGTRPVTRGLRQEIMVNISVNKSAMSEPIASFIFSGALQRHPNLKIVSVESGIGWMAFLVPWMDSVWNKHRYHTRSELTEPPSHYFHRQVFGTFIDDEIGVRNRDVIGVENILWSSDYPHVNSSWPTSREYIERHFGDVPPVERRKMVCENTAHLYDIPVGK